jgi:hypothetical protein
VQHQDGSNSHDSKVMSAKRFLSQTALLSAVAMLVPLSGAHTAKGANPVLYPRLHEGQILWYQISYRENRAVKSASRMIMPNLPDSSNVDAHGLLHVLVVSVETRASAPVYRFEVQFEPTQTGARLAASGQQPRSAAGAGKSVAFTLLADGSAANVSGLDALTPTDRRLFAEWLARFAAAGKFPKKALKHGSKWESEEPEPAASPIAALTWRRKSEYVNDDTCSVARLTKDGEAVEDPGRPQACSVILTTSELVQRSKPKDTTPQDFRQHGLRTAGTAAGANQVISQISVTSGLLVRAREDARQAMEVTIARADGSNQVHYSLQATSHTEVLQVTAPDSGIPR